jgi:predicted glycosyltransferase
MSSPKVLFYVQHLLGIGHLRRTATLARNMVRSGLDVTIVSGGHRIDIDLGGARLEQLPATRATDLFFKELVDESGQLIDEGWKRQRANRLMEIYRDLSPDVLIFELFPFGRRQMRFELSPLLEAAKSSVNKPVIVSSVRDILVAQKKPQRNDEMLKIIEDYFDHVMVHGDPDLISLDKTFPHSSRISNKLHYTGYVVDKTGRRLGEGHDGYDEVIVSSGGGAVGFDLLKIAMQARALSAAKDRTWRILIGAAAEEQEFFELKSLATEGIIVERARRDFTSLLMNCVLSISQGGYNTVMEILHARCRAVIVPYAGGLETEQTLRAELLAKKGVLQIVNESELTPVVLAQKVNLALQGPPSSAEIKVDGGKVAAELICDWAGRK